MIVTVCILWVVFVSYPLLGRVGIVPVIGEQEEVPYLIFVTGVFMALAAMVAM